MTHVTAHAIERYQERVENLSHEAVTERLSCPAVQVAAAFGACFVRLSTGHRIVIKDGDVITVLPAENFKRQIARQGLGRMGRSTRFLEDE